MMLMMTMVIKMMLAITMVMRMAVMGLLKYLVGQRHRKPGRELEGFWQTAVEPSWGKNRYHCINIYAIIDSHHHGSHVITTTIIVQVFLFLTLPFYRLRISPLSAGKTRWEPKGKKVPRWPASSTDQALYSRGEREFPFPVIPKNGGLWFPFPNFGNGFFHSLPVPEFQECLFFHSLPVPKF